VFNKTDVARHEFAVEWMSDFEAYADALEADASYASSLSRSLSLVLDEFYANLRTAGGARRRACTGWRLAALQPRQLLSLSVPLPLGKLLRQPGVARVAGSRCPRRGAAAGRSPGARSQLLLDGACAGCS
jgi:hypothetical protein